MSRPRKAVQKPLDIATEALVWRARIACEDNTPQNMKRLGDALGDYEASRHAGQASQGVLGL